MNNTEYLYYMHGTNQKSNTEIHDYFKNGLLNYRGQHAHSTMYPVRQSDTNNLGKTIQKYAQEHNFDIVFIIRIPKRYMFPQIQNGTIMQYPMPIWKDTGNKDAYDREIYYLIPQLIHGVYRKKDDSIKFNDNYCPIYDPSGLKYSDEQIEYLLTNSCIDWYNFAINRKNSSYEQLRNYDLQNNIWKHAIEFYNNSLGINDYNGLKKK